MQWRAVTTPDLNNPDEGDLWLSNAGKTGFVGGDVGNATDDNNLMAEVDQRLRMRIHFERGEWFLDTRLGLPLFSVIFDKATSEAEARAILYTVVAGTPGIASLSFFSFVLTHETNSAEVVFAAVLADGRVLDSRDYQPYILQAT